MSQPPPRTPAATLLVSGSPTATYAATPHVLASHAALEVMERGGNAIDGAIAANAVQGVVAPDTCGIGGDLFALIHRPGDTTPLCLNASGRAGSGVSASKLRETHDEMPYRHPWTITVPGCVAGWAELAAKQGQLPLSVSLGPAIELARSGFPVSLELADSLARLTDMIGSQSSAAALYPNGEPAAAGATVRRPDIADTLAAIAAAGPAAFYKGTVADAIAAVTDGGLTADDIASMSVDWVEPIGIDVFGLTGWTVPPNTQGYLALAALWLFEKMAPPTDPADPRYVHAAIEAYKAVAWERDDLVSDPDTAPLDPSELLSTTRLAGRLEALSMNRATSWPSPAPAPGGTAYLCTRDSAGVGVSLIQSNFAGIGAGISADGTGIFLHNRGGGFNLTEGHPNELRPGRRPLHTLSPTIWTQHDQLRLILGTRGGQYQPQLLIQLAAHLLYSDVPRALGQPLPRWQVDGWGTGESPVVQIEERTPRPIVDGLEALGHNVERVADWNQGWGPMSVIGVANDDVYASVDPRVSTSAALSR
ncbi:MAG: gamma-glutamyltranspeptidase [Acidimicrobiia bacterium]|nr:gamma-glutamyltranspeptidase [Acidimicrobiia bacterium]